MITREQVRAARRLLGWSQVRLAGRSALCESTVAKFEAGAQRLPSPSLEAIRHALEAAGVELIDAGGVKLKIDLVVRE